MTKSLLPLLFALTACASAAPPATVLAGTAPSRQIGAPDGYFCVDAARSSFTAVARALGVRHSVKVTDFRGAAQVSGSRPVTLWVVADLSTAQGDSELLTGLLRSRRFLYVERHPSAHFESLEVQGSDTTHQVTGRLTLRGRSQVLAVTGTHELVTDGVRARSRFSVRREDFGVLPGAPYEWVLGSTIDIELDLLARECDASSSEPPKAPAPDESDSEP